MVCIAGHWQPASLGRAQPQQLRANMYSAVDVAPTADSSANPWMLLRAESTDDCPTTWNRCGVTRDYGRIVRRDLEFIVLVQLHACPKLRVRLPLVGIARWRRISAQYPGACHG